MSFCRMAFKCSLLSLTCNNILRKKKRYSLLVNYDREYGRHIIYCFKEWLYRILILILEFHTGNKMSITHTNLSCVKIWFVLCYKADLSWRVWTEMESPCAGPASWGWSCWYFGCYRHSQSAISCSTEWSWHALLVGLWNDQNNGQFIKKRRTYVVKYLNLHWMWL